MKRLTLLLTFVFLCTSNLYAQIGTYSFGGVTDCSDTAIGVDAQPANATFADFSRMNVTCVSGSGFYNNDNWCITCADNTNIDFTEYIEFSITADAGYTITATQLDYSQRGNNNVADEYRVAVSTDNFATTAEFFDGAVVGNTNINENWDFADLTTTDGGTLTFRWYIYGDERANTGSSAAPIASGAFRVDNVSLLGSISTAPPAVPTLSEWGLIILSISLLIVGTLSIIRLKKPTVQ